MADHPIPFSDPMVRALLDGRKTQTRRVIKPQGTRYWQEFAPCGDLVWWTDVRHRHGPTTMVILPQVGDRLWVRETFTTTQHGKPVYRADARDSSGYRWSSIVPGDPDREVRWRSPIHMPRWASRITLVVTEVRVQRLQDITCADARAEGVITEEWEEWREDAGCVGLPSGSRIEDERDVFLRQWVGCPDDNPWVAAYTLTVNPCNIDEMCDL